MILAGGAASRLAGAAKGLVAVGGARVIDRVADALRATTDGLLLVANDPAADDWLAGVPRVPDLRPGLGPLGGIHAALTHSGTSVLVVAWDMPFVSRALLAALRRHDTGGYVAVVPESAGGRLEPTCALYTPGCRLALEEWLDGGRRGAAAFLTALAGVRRLVVDEVARLGDPERLFFSVNTPEALDRAAALAGPV